jgi:hypothetical protein
LIFDFSQKSSSYNSVWIRIRFRIRTFFRIRIRIQPKHSEYFGFGSTTLVYIKSYVSSGILNGSSLIFLNCFINLTSISKRKCCTVGKLEVKKTNFKSNTRIKLVKNCKYFLKTIYRYYNKTRRLRNNLRQYFTFFSISKKTRQNHY